MRIVDQPVEDATGQCRIPDLIVPVGDGQLTGEDRGSGGVTVIADFQEVAAFGIGERRDGPIIDAL